MSDALADTAVAPEAAPAEAPPSTPAPAPEAPAPPIPVREARQALRHQEPVKTAAQARNELGQFQSPGQVDTEPVAEAEATPEEVPSVTPETPDAEISATPEGSDSAEAPAVAEVGTTLPEGYTMVEIPEGHWARERGLAELAIPDTHADTFKGILKDPIRRVELDDARSHVGQLEQQARELFTEVVFYRDKARAILADPSIGEEVRAVRQAYGDEKANLMVEGLMAKDLETLAEAKQQTRETAMQARAQEGAARYKASAHREMSSRYPLFDYGERDRLLKAFAVSVQHGIYPDMHKEHLVHYADSVYNVDPRVQAANAAAEKAKAEATTAAQAKLRSEEEQRQRGIEGQRARNPLGRVPSGVSGGSIPPAAGEVNVAEVRRGFRNRSRAG